MPAYSYYKALPLKESPRKHLIQEFARKTTKLVPNLLLVLGATAVTTVIYPMVSYQLTNKQWHQQTELANRNQDVVESVATAPQLEPGNQTDGVTQPVVVSNIDYTKASNWFPQANPQSLFKKNTPLVSSYTLSIPQLKIENMNVTIGGNDLDKYLIHYSGTALPGEFGNTVIFGHSVLPVFYNPKSYISVFSTIPTLKKGDEIYITYDEITYLYKVTGYHEVLPNQVEVLEQRYDRKTVSLITCVPPGTYLKRGIIQADLVEN